MKAPQLFCGVLALAMSVTACQKQNSRAELKQAAGDTASRIKTESVKAGEQLSDMWLATKIHSKFIGDRDIKARDVSVTSHDGVVTLKGRVLNESAHQLALAIAQHTDGVTQVVDQLDVEVAGPPPAPRAQNAGTPGAVATTGTPASPSSTTGSASAVSSTADDARITTSIQSKYFMDDRIKGRHINVSTNDRVVTLHGEVADDIERAEALLLARTTEGVKRVEDSLTLSSGTTATRPASSVTSSAAAAAAPPVAGSDADAALSERVKSQLASDTQVKSAPIEVTAKSGVVLLQGTVSSSAAKQRALTLVRGLDGVTQVVDRLQISTTKRSGTSRAKAANSPARKAKK